MRTVLLLTAAAAATLLMTTGAANASGAERVMTFTVSAESLEYRPTLASGGGPLSISAGGCGVCNGAFAGTWRATGPFTYDLSGTFDGRAVSGKFVTTGERDVRGTVTIDRGDGKAASYETGGTISIGAGGCGPCVDLALAGELEGVVALEVESLDVRGTLAAGAGCVPCQGKVAISATLSRAGRSARYDAAGTALVGGDDFAMFANFDIQDLHQDSAPAVSVLSTITKTMRTTMKVVLSNLRA